MIKDILLEVGPSQTRLALMEDGEVAELFIEREGSERSTGNILLGRVANVLPGMQAAFVDIGQPKNGFLYAGDIRIDPSEFGPEAEALGDQLRKLPIQKLVKSGQEILVQVIKEPGGDKGPRITNNVTLPGRLTVLLPTVNYVGISRRIENEAERARLRELAEAARPEGMGLIVRTAAEGVGAEEIARDVEYLKRLWASIVTRATTSKAPALLHRDECLAHRAVRDMLTDDVRALWVDDRAQCEQLRSAAALISPELAARVTFYEGERPLFALHRVDVALEHALSRRVWLKSGGYLVFDYAEALTVIDVNTGKFTGSHSLSDTVFAINCEAAAEIAHQLRLRNIGGIIVIDFIDMDLPEQRDQLLQLFRQHLKRDRTRTNLVGLTGLGLVEMTRKKTHPPLYATMRKPCPACQGSGMVLSEQSAAHDALSALRSDSQRMNAPCWLIEASPAVTEQLAGLQPPEGIRAFVHPDAARADGEYEIKPAQEHSLPPKSRPLSRRG